MFVDFGIDPNRQSARPPLALAIQNKNIAALTALLQCSTDLLQLKEVSVRRGSSAALIGRPSNPMRCDFELGSRGTDPSNIAEEVLRIIRRNLSLRGNALIF